MTTNVSPAAGVDDRRPALTETDSGDIRVLVVDDHLAFGELLALAVDNSPGVACVGVATSIADALRLVDRDAPDLVVTDLRMAGSSDGLDLCRRLSSGSDVCVILLTAYADQSVIAEAAAAGACAVLAKTGSLDDILRTIRRAQRGDFVVDPALVAPAADPATGTSTRTGRNPVALSDREAEVLALLARGLDVTAVARRLFLSVHTVRGYVKSLLLKLDAHSQLEAVVKAMELGLIPPAGGLDGRAGS